MIKSALDNVRKRQRELNQTVNDAFAKKKKVDVWKDEMENSDVDKFFKIDLASKYREVDYIMDILKEGKSLYIHRALKKCQWLYNAEYAHVINPQYLHTNVFLEAPARVKKLILKTVAMKVRDEGRAAEFFEYCVNINMIDVALKCLVFTSEEFKLNLLVNLRKTPLNKTIHKKRAYVRSIIGQSFDLLKAYLNTVDSQEWTLLDFKHLYFVDDNKYLDLLEKSIKKDDEIQFYTSSLRYLNFDRKFCIDVVKNHKDRILAKPQLYITYIINEDILVQNISSDYAKQIIVALLPPSVDIFWNSWRWSYIVKMIFPLVNREEMFSFLKNIFNNKYPNEEFESHISFYKQEYYEFMTAEQRTEWANEMKRKKDFFGAGMDYLWNKFISFERAFEETKNFVNAAENADKRKDIMNTSVESRRSNRDLEKLFIYYNERHASEPGINKIHFLNAVIEHQNVYKFDNSCWSAFYILLVGVQLFKEPEYPYDRWYFYRRESRATYKSVTLIYHLLHKKEMLKEFEKFLLGDDFTATTALARQLKKLNNQQQDFVFNYVYTFYTNKIKEYKVVPYTNDCASNVKGYFFAILHLVESFKVPPITDDERYRPRPTKTCTMEVQELQPFQEDENLTATEQTEFKTYLDKNDPVRINTFLKKIKIFYPDGVSKFLTLFEERISENSQNLDFKSVEACIDAIFYLGDENVKVSLIKKYDPKNARQHQIDVETYKNIQKMICRNAFKSLPPLPSSVFLINFMEGDTARLCLRLFSTYVAALPTSMCIRLVYEVLDAQVAIQKHYLRLIFQSFGVHVLKNISKCIWEKTDNVCLRSVIYKSLYNRIRKRSESELYEILISFTLDLHERDEKVLFALMGKNNMPKDFLGSFKKAAWQALTQLIETESIIRRKAKVIYGIQQSLSDMDTEFVKMLVDEHLAAMFAEGKLHLCYSEGDFASLYAEKWNLVVTFLGYGGGCDTKEIENIAQSIIRKCVENWKVTHSGTYIYQRCCWEFIQNLNNISNESHSQSEHLIPIYKKMLSAVEEALQEQDNYINNNDTLLPIDDYQALKILSQRFRKDKNFEVLTTSSIDFSKEVVKIVTKHIGNKVYLGLFSEKVNEAINVYIEELSNVINLPQYDFERNRNDALTSLVASLVEYEALQTILLIKDLAKQCEKYSGDKHDLVLNISTISDYSENKELIQLSTWDIIIGNLCRPWPLLLLFFSICFCWWYFRDIKLSF